MSLLTDFYYIIIVRIYLSLMLMGICQPSWSGCAEIFPENESVTGCLNTFETEQMPVTLIPTTFVRTSPQQPASMLQSTVRGQTSDIDEVSTRTPSSNSSSKNVFHTSEMNSPSNYFHTAVLNSTTEGAEFWGQVATAYFEFCKRSCHSRTISSVRENCRSCFCDDVCLAYGDCCPDVYARIQHGPTKDSLTSSLLCSKTSYGSKKEFLYWMVSKCPEDESNRNLQELCLTTSTSHWNFTQPVTDAKTNFTYKNIYCAVCHGIISTVPWKMQIEVYNARSVLGLTSPESIYKSVINSEENELVYKPLDNFASRVRECSLAISRCNESGEWKVYDPMIERACGAFWAVFKLKQEIYKNPFCLLCNSDYTWEDLLALEDRLWLTAVLGSPLLMLLDFGDGPASIQGADNWCSDEQVLDTYEGKCREVICALGKKRRNSHDVTCYSSPTMTNLYGYQFCLEAEETAQQFQEVKNKTIARNLVIVLNKMFLHLGLEWVSLEIFQLPASTNSSVKQELFLIIVKYRASAPLDRDDVDMKIISNISQILTEFQNAFFLDHLTLSMACAVEHCLPARVQGSYVQTVSSPPFHLYVNASQLNMKNFAKNTFPGAYVPVTHHLLCAAVQLLSDEFVYGPGERSLTLAHSGETITSPYAYINNLTSVLVCLDKYQRGREQTRDLSLRIISLCSTSISLFFLVMSLSIYCCVAELRSIAGANTMALSIFLLWAQTTLEISSDVEMMVWLCQAVGVATHFLWLCVAFAQNVCTFHMFFTLSFPLQSHTATSSTGTTFRKYISYVVASSSILIVVTVAWQSVVYGDSGYGGDVCYIRRSLARIVMFATPLALTISLNFAMFVATIVRLRSLPVLNSTRSHKVSLLLYTKLSCLTGVTWFLGFLASATNWSPLSYAFAILQGGQGVFLFLGFLANKRVATLLLKKTRADNRRQSKGTRSTQILSSLKCSASSHACSTTEKVKYVNDKVLNVK